MKKLIIFVDRAAFHMFDVGLKPEEYRSTSQYWIRRLISEDFKHYSIEDLASVSASKKFKQFSSVEIRLGYAKNAPRLEFEYLGTEIGLPNLDYIPKSKTKYGFNPEEEVFKIKLGKRL